MKEPVLVILAAGMGSRYGGLKQIDAVGSNGESIIDFSIYDAIEAGFKRLFLIIRREHQEVFEESLVKKIRPFIEVEYCFQDLDDIPAEFSVPKGREKPWGTTHALLAIRHQIDAPFMIINADDYYGKESYKVMYNFLTSDVSDQDYALVGYILENTLTDHGTVSRAVCEVSDGYLSEIVERKTIAKIDGEVKYTEDGESWTSLAANSLVSMNYWGFTPKVIEYCTDIFTNFLRNNLENNPLTCEHVIPTAVGDMIGLDEVKVHMLSSKDRWFGITYQEDKPLVVDLLQKYKSEGKYPENLWKSNKNLSKNY